ncbi:MAG: polysaccharide biosynthesis/export family protein [Planctomycetes bacterium]|nr:polysaccharide biosynthesis/export family protein [Planctomycetota bacterium]
MSIGSEEPLRSLRKRSVEVRLWYVLLSLVMASIVGCSDNVKLPTPQELIEFETLGRSEPAVDISRLVKARLESGPYHVVPGEVLELTMPSILQIVTVDEPDLRETTPFVCRISDSGMITLPVVGELEVTGLSLAEIEAKVTDAYHPKYARTRPSVLAKVLEHKTYKVSIGGAVNVPGIYELAWDQMTMVSLLMQAQGLDVGLLGEGAAVIRIDRTQHAPIGRTENMRITGSHSGSRHASQSLSHPPQLTFRPDRKNSTTGILTIRREGRTVVSARLSIESVGQRQRLLHQAIQIEPTLSTLELDEQISLLATRLTQTNVGATRMLAGLGTDTDAFADPLPETDLAPGNGEPPSLPDDAIILPIRGLNIPFTDVVLHEGDAVTVEPLKIERFTVIGLVKNQGNFEYPRDQQYTLSEALAFAGGLDAAANPRYAVIYRLDSQGQIQHVTYNINKSKNDTHLASPMTVRIKPGDIVAVEHTRRTRTKLILDRLFRVNLGAYVPILR